MFGALSKANCFGPLGPCLWPAWRRVCLLALALAVAPALAGCEGGNFGAPRMPADYAGLWTSTSGNNLMTCSGKIIDQPFEPFTVLLRAGTGTSLDLIEVDQADLVTPVCTYHFTVSGNRATLTDTQSCTVDDGSGTTFTTTYSQDALVLSANTVTLDETSVLDDSDGCHNEATRRYVRGRP